MLRFSVDGTVKSLEEERFSCWYWCCTLEGSMDGSDSGGALPTHTPRTHNLSVTSQLLLGLVITSHCAQTDSGLQASLLQWS